MSNYNEKINPQMKSADSAPVTDSTSTDSSLFEQENSKSKNHESSWSALSEGTSCSSGVSISADGFPSDLVARGTSSVSQHPPSSDPHSLISSLKELATSEKMGACGLRYELQGFLCKVSDMEQQLQSLKKMLLHKQNYISTLETNLKRIEGRNTSLKNEVSDLKRDNEELRNRLLNSETAGPSQFLASLQKKRDNSISPTPSEKELETELDRVLHENASLKQKIIGLEQELSQTIQKLDHTRQRQEQRCKEMESLLMHVTKELQNVETEREEVASLLAEVLNKNSGAKREEGVKTQFESLLLLQKPALTAKELITLKDRLFASHKQIDVLEKDFREEHEQRLAAERDLARMKAAVRDLERECDTLRLQVQFLQEDFFKEREDKKALERSLQMKEMTVHPDPMERNWPRGEAHRARQFYPREHLEGELYGRSQHIEIVNRHPRPLTPRPFHYHGIANTDVECDGGQSIAEINSAADNKF